MDSSGDIWKIINLGFEKSQRSVTHDILRYINILTYLITYLLRTRDVTRVSECCALQRRRFSEIAALNRPIARRGSLYDELLYILFNLNCVSFEANKLRMYWTRSSPKSSRLVNMWLWMIKHIRCRLLKSRCYGNEFSGELATSAKPHLHSSHWHSKMD